MVQFILLCALGYPDASGVYTPMFVEVPAVRTTSSARGELLRDIDMRLPAGHIYSAQNLITWAHETTHGINANVRNLYIKRDKIQYNAFYIPGGKAALVVDPPGTIKQVAEKTPKSLRQLRKRQYDNYIVKTQGQWDDRPLYICDEWSAYTNGVAVRNELKIDNKLEIENMVFMGTMALVMLWAIEPEDAQLQAYVAWNWERCMTLIVEANLSDPDEALLVLRHSVDCSELRKYMKDYFGEAWVSEIFGF